MSTIEERALVKAREVAVRDGVPADQIDGYAAALLRTTWGAGTKMEIAAGDFRTGVTKAALPVMRKVMAACRAMTR